MLQKPSFESLQFSDIQTLPVIGLLKSNFRALPTLEHIAWVEPWLSFRRSRIDAAARRFLPDTRCIILADGFYKFTDPEPGQKLKTKWLFARPGDKLLGIAGIVRPFLDANAFAMLTVDPGPQVKPLHDRQIVLFLDDRWADWLNRAPTGRKMPPAAWEGDGFARGPGAPDPRDAKPKPRDIYIPDLHIDTLRQKTRNFR